MYCGEVAVNRQTIKHGLGHSLGNEAISYFVSMCAATSSDDECGDWGAELGQTRADLILPKKRGVGGASLLRLR